MTQPVLIVTPTFNGSGFIQEAIESVRRQTYSNWIMVIVDDASTDNTIPLLQNYLLEDPRFQVIQLAQNSGRPARPRNEAIRFALDNHIAFDFIAFLDDDDVWMPNKLKMQIAKMDENPEVGFLHSQIVPFIIGDRLKYNYRKDVRTFRRFLLYNHVSTSSVMLRRSQVEKFFPLFDEDIYLKSVEDAELWARLLANGVPTATTQSEIHSYRIVPGSLSDTTLPIKLRRIFYLYARIAVKNPQIAPHLIFAAALLKLTKYTLEEWWGKLRALGASTSIATSRRPACTS